MAAKKVTDETQEIVEVEPTDEELTADEEIELDEALKNAKAVELEFPADEFPVKDYPHISGRKFKLDYDRKSSVELEYTGFKIADLAPDSISERPIKAVFPLFYGSFRKNHPDVDQETMDEVYDAIGAENAQIVFENMYLRVMLNYRSLQEGMVDARPKSKARLRLV